MPPLGVRETELENPEPLLSDTWKSVGAATLRLAVRFAPETEKSCSVEESPRFTEPKSMSVPEMEMAAEEAGSNSDEEF